MKKLGFCTLLMILCFPNLFGDSFDKGIKLLTEGKYQEALLHFRKNFEQTKIKYLNVKNTRQPKKQKQLADEHCVLLLGYSYSLYKLEKLTQSKDATEDITIFFDEHSKNYHLFRAYAFKLLGDIHKKLGSELFQESYLEKARKSYAEYKALSSIPYKHEGKLEILLGEIY